MTKPRGRRKKRGRSAPAALAVVAMASLVAACSTGAHVLSTTRTGRVLLVGTFAGKAGPYRSIQAAVEAARPGDWILVAPGDYHEADDAAASPAAASDGDFGGVVITTPDTHLRGMNRSTVVVDGTSTSATKPCSPAAAQQDLGPLGPGGKAEGRNGIVVWKADGVSIENLTVCNFLGGAGDAGNEIWWNGGDGSGQIGLTGYEGNYLTATSTYFGGTATAAQYGIFSSNAQGPGEWSQLYASNFADSGMYVGACHQVCGVTISHAWMEYSALGYSGTNSGGAVVIEDSQFDDNQDGVDTNTQLNGDPPAPQDGACPGGRVSAVTHTHSCWVFVHNDVHDNDNPNVPKSGNAANGPTGTGMTVSGGRRDTVMDNRFENNGAWGILFVPYPDSNPPSLNQTCAGTGGVELSGFGCVYDPEGDALIDNSFHHDGYFGNPTNGDYGQVTVSADQPRNCYAGNRAPDGSAPSDLERTQPTCGPLTTTANAGGQLLSQVLCDTGFGTCPAGAHYPQTTAVVMHPLPAELPTMPDPCQGVPANPWCPGGRPR
jgi:hypothetical protein